MERSCCRRAAMRRVSSPSYSRRSPSGTPCCWRPRWARWASSDPRTAPPDTRRRCHARGAGPLWPTARAARGAARSPDITSCALGTALLPSHANGRGCHAAAVAGLALPRQAQHAPSCWAAATPQGCGAPPAWLAVPPATAAAPSRGSLRIGQVVTAALVAGRARRGRPLPSRRRGPAGRRPRRGPPAGCRTPGQAPQGRRPGAAGKPDEERLTHLARPRRLRPLHAVRSSGRPKPVVA